MKNLLTVIYVFLLASISKAADVGLDTQDLKNKTIKNNVIARQGTATCIVADISKTSIFEKNIENFTISELRKEILLVDSLEHKQEILSLIEQALINEK